MSLTCYEIDDKETYTIKIIDILHDLDIPYSIESTQILQQNPKIIRNWILIDDIHIHNIINILNTLKRPLKLLK